MNTRTDLAIYPKCGFEFSKLYARGIVPRLPDIYFQLLYWKNKVSEVWARIIDLIT